MNNRHLPAGQAMQGVGGPGSEMGPGTPGPRGSHRQRGYNPASSYVPSHPNPHNMYAGYGMGHPSAQAYHPYYSSHQMNPYVQQQQPQPGYMYPHQPHFPPTQYNRSPPAHNLQQQQQPTQQQTQTQPSASHPHPQGFAPIVTSGMGQAPYGRQPQQSSAVAPPYQPATAAPHHASTIASQAHQSHTPSSTSANVVVQSTAATPGAPQTQPPPQSTSSPAPTTPKPESLGSRQTTAEAPSEPASQREQPEDEFQGDKFPVAIPLPWTTHPDEPFPRRIKKRRRKTPGLQGTAATVMPENNGHATSEPQPGGTDQAKSEVQSILDADTAKETASEKQEQPPVAQRPASPPVSEHGPAKSTISSETTPAASAPKGASATPPKPSTVPRVPAVPVVPRVPKKPLVSEKTAAREAKTTSVPTDPQPTSQKIDATSDVSHASKPEAKLDESPAETKPVAAPTQPPRPVSAAPQKPKTWSGLFANTSSKSATVNGNQAASSGARTPGSDVASRAIGGAPAGSLSVTETLRSYKVGGSSEVHFLEPRGLQNTGNMCYMNSILQVLIFCVPFYDFLNQVLKKAAHSFKNETPLLNSMLLFREEFKVLATADSPESLRRHLKPDNLEKFGEPFTPEFVYEAIKKLPRFASMIRGHQQDAEEFLGFFLESLHDECMQAMKGVVADSSASSPAASSPPISTYEAADANGWMEVGYRQKPAVTRSSGHPQVQTPITKIFGGQLRSELRVTGLKDSVTLEPYQPLQLDITANNVRNIIDALRGLTNPETLQGNFKSPRGTDKATKQVFIDSLPPVLILHLKRFQFDTEGTVKVWKKVGYPLELEIPKEVLHRSKRNLPAPKYKLSAVVYHHGKNASGGHYTVDVRRQDGVEWIRIDDTVIRRIRSEDVAEGGAEEPAKSAAWNESKKEGSAAAGTANRFSGIGGDESGDEEGGWKHVAGPANGKKWSSVVNGNASNTAAPSKKTVPDNIKENKVAYILFYQRI